MASEVHYATIEDLAKLIHDKLEGYGRHSPGKGILIELFRVMYAASMATEEGQSITFEVTWIDPESPDPAPRGRIAADRWTTVPFASGFNISTRNLIKAARATDPRTSSFAAYSPEDGPPFIWGLVDQGTSAYNFKRFDSDRGPDRGGVFQASVNGVGHLAVSIGYEPLAELRIDRILTGGTDPFEDGPIFEALRPGLENYINAVKSEVPAEIYELRDHWDDSLAGQWLETLARILLRIRDMRHGGALLITPDTSTADLEVKYQIEYVRLREALHRWGKSTIEKTHCSDLIFGAMHADEATVDMDIYLRESISMGELEEIESELDSGIWFISCLSRVDGLVLMGPELTAHGFGTVITAEIPPKVLRVAESNRSLVQKPLLSYDQFGTRHRSMMRYCDAHPGSIGFVISQDGDIRGITKVRDDLLLWDNIKLERNLSESED